VYRIKKRLSKFSADYLAGTVRQTDLLREAFRAWSALCHCQYVTAKHYIPGRQSSAQSTAQAMNTWSQSLGNLTGKTTTFTSF
jgi:hypothetical protein